MQHSGPKNLFPGVKLPPDFESFNLPSSELETFAKRHGCSVRDILVYCEAFNTTDFRNLVSIARKKNTDVACLLQYLPKNNGCITYAPEKGLGTTQTHYKIIDLLSGSSRDPLDFTPSYEWERLIESFCLETEQKIPQTPVKRRRDA